MNVASAKERFAASRTLVSFLMSLEGRKVKIELRNDTLITGILEEVDSRMNVSLVNASVWRQCEPRDTQQPEDFTAPFEEFESFFVQGSKIRYIHMDMVGDPMKATEEAVECLLHRKSQGPKRIMKKRLMKYEEEKQFVKSIKEEREKKKQSSLQ